MKSDCSLPLWVLFKRSLSSIWVSECSLISSEVTLKSPRSHPKVTLKSSWTHPESSWSHPDVFMKSSWSHHEKSEPKRWRLRASDKFGLDARTLWLLELLSESKLQNKHSLCQVIVHKYISWLFIIFGNGTFVLMLEVTASYVLLCCYSIWTFDQTLNTSSNIRAIWLQ